ncbi:hypothetical protein IE81DRAFT_322235 [Ceraceosorus guamensis]|uniref:Transmembrane protein n=1 Tax=Ceraceosorus guamensis TaxID=1522189 RepID=A0A316W4K3_9BASI|nr:hypothetical protein IE81DRAFT_322235 [Ceraceosorus guamensis]PWN43581.1 hypothetical protein IE81DRAFT_322235 [Ceraceosorus guamensis]
MVVDARATYCVAILAGAISSFASMLLVTAISDHFTWLFILLEIFSGCLGCLTAIELLLPLRSRLRRARRRALYSHPLGRIGASLSESVGDGGPMHHSTSSERSTLVTKWTSVRIFVVFSIRSISATLLTRATIEDLQHAVEATAQKLPEQWTVETMGVRTASEPDRATAKALLSLVWASVACLTLAVCMAVRILRRSTSPSARAADKGSERSIADLGVKDRTASSSNGTEQPFTPDAPPRAIVRLRDKRLWTEQRSQSCSLSNAYATDATSLSPIVSAPGTLSQVESVQDHALSRTSSQTRSARNLRVSFTFPPQVCGSPLKYASGLEEGNTRSECEVEHGKRVPSPRGNGTSRATRTCLYPARPAPACVQGESEVEAELGAFFRSLTA